MELAHASRWTIDGDPEMYAGVVAYFDSRQPPDRQELWWDMQYVHGWASRRGDGYSYKFWLRKVARLVHGIHICNEGFKPRTNESQPHVLANICTTKCLLLIIWRCAAYTKSRPLSEAFCKCLCACVARTVPNLPVALRVVPIKVGDVTFVLHVGTHGSISGFVEILRGCFSSRWQVSLQCAWDRMRRDGYLDAPNQLFQGGHSWVTVVMFLVSFPTWRKLHHQSSLPSGFWLIMSQVRDSIVSWMSGAVEWYTRDVYVQCHNVQKSPPSRKRVPCLTTRPYVKVHAEAAWEILRKTMSVNVSVGQVIDVRREDDDAGCSSKCGSFWERYSQGLYLYRLGLAWPRTYHLCITADASNHSFQDGLLGVASLLFNVRAITRIDGSSKP